NSSWAGLKMNGASEPVLGLNLRQFSVKYGKSVRRRVARSLSLLNRSSQEVIATIAGPTDYAVPGLWSRPPDHAARPICARHSSFMRNLVSEPKRAARCQQ